MDFYIPRLIRRDEQSTKKYNKKVFIAFSPAYDTVGTYLAKIRVLNIGSIAN